MSHRACKEGFRDSRREKKMIKLKVKRGAGTAADIKLGWPHTWEQSLQKRLRSDLIPSSYTSQVKLTSFDVSLYVCMCFVWSTCRWVPGLMSQQPVLSDRSQASFGSSTNSLLVLLTNSGEAVIVCAFFFFKHWTDQYERLSVTLVKKQESFVS